MRGDAIPCRFCGFLQMPYLAFNKSRTRWRLALPTDTCPPCANDEMIFFEVNQA